MKKHLVVLTSLFLSFFSTENVNAKITKDLKENKNITTVESKNFFSSKVTSYHEKLDQKNNFIGFLFDIKILNGQIKKGDKIDIVNKDNIRETFIISNIYKDKEENTYNNFIVNDYCSLEVQALKKNSQLRDKYYENLYITNVGFSVEENMKFDKSIKTTEVTIKNEPIVNNTVADQKEKLSFTKDGNSFNIDNPYGSFIFYKKGGLGLYEGKPYLHLSFNLKNNSKINFIIKNFEPKKGLIDPKMLEVTFTTNENGKKISQNNYDQGNINNKTTDFKFEITKLSMLDEKEITISSNFQGLLYFLSNSKTSKIELGEIRNIKVTVLDAIY